MVSLLKSVLVLKNIKEYQIMKIHNKRLYADNGDDHHASLQGSYLSALTHYLAMFSTEVVTVIVYHCIIVIVRWWATRRK